MPGMNSGLSPGDPTLVAAFRSALLHQGAIALIAIVFLWLVWATARAWRLTTPAAKAGRAAGRGLARGQRPGRRRPGDGGCCGSGSGCSGSSTGSCRRSRRWRAGWPPQVIQPTAAASPGWVQHLVNWGGTIWSYHPIQAGAAAVWIQVGIGAWLIVAARGPWSRLAGLASVGWGLIVWVFGESFGGIFAPGLSWLTGAPGAVLLYVVAGALIALPEGAWREPAARAAAAGRGSGCSSSGWPCCRPGPAAVSGRARWTASPGTLAGMVQYDVGDPAAALPVLVAVRLRVVRREPRVRGEPGGGDRAGRDGRDLPDRAAPAGPVRGVVRRSCSAWPTGCWSRTSASWAGSAPTRTA